MKTKKTRQINLFDGGKDEWEQTKEYQIKVNEIRKEVSDKYAPILSGEKNWLKRQLIKLRFWIEMKRRIDEVSSWRNLHVMAR